MNSGLLFKRILFAEKLLISLKMCLLHSLNFFYCLYYVLNRIVESDQSVGSSTVSANAVVSNDSSANVVESNDSVQEQHESTPR